MTKQRMLALRLVTYGGPQAVRLEELPLPDPGPGELLVRLDAASLNPADAKMRDGAFRSFRPVTFPRTLGGDGAGTVLAIGEALSGSPFERGDRVAGVAGMGRDGTHATHALLPVGHCAALPSSVSASQGAAAGVAGLSALIPIEEMAGLGPGSRILIHGGAGGVGSFAVQLARLTGATVTATCSRRNVEFVESLGAEGIAYDTDDFTRAGPVFDVVFDTIGGEVHGRSFMVLKQGGLLLRLNAAPVPPPAREDVSVQLAEIRPTPERLGRLFDLIGSGRLTVRVEQAFTLAQHADAYAAVSSGHARGKVVFVC